MEAVSRTDFSGGVSEQFQAAASMPDAVAKARGFVLGGTKSIRTQWSVELIDNGNGWRAARGFSTNNADYVVGITPGHELQYVTTSTMGVDFSDNITWDAEPGVDASWMQRLTWGSYTYVSYIRLDAPPTDTVNVGIFADGSSTPFTTLSFNSSNWYIHQSFQHQSPFEVVTSFTYDCSNSAAVEYQGFSGSLGASIGPGLMTVAAPIKRGDFYLSASNYEMNNPVNISTNGLVGSKLVTATPVSSGYWGTGTLSVNSSNSAVATAYLSGWSSAGYAGSGEAFTLLIIPGQTAGTTTISFSDSEGYLQPGSPSFSVTNHLGDIGVATDIGKTLTSTHMPVCEIPRSSSTYTATNKEDGSAKSEKRIVLYAGNGLLFNSPDVGSEAVVVYETSPGVLGFETFSGAARYPSISEHPDIADQLFPAEGKMPHARVGVMWGDRLILGDIRWYESDQSDTRDTDTDAEDIAFTPPNPLNDTSTARFRNALWVSEPGNAYQFDPLSVDIPVSADSRIVDIKVCDLGLIVFTTTAAGSDGLILLRGTANNYKVEKLRDLSAARGATDVDYQVAGHFWSQLGAYAFISDDGSISLTNGSEVQRLDGPLSFDHHKASWRDHIHTIGPFLFAVHTGRLLCMRSFGNAGAWTELSPPWDPALFPITSMTSADGDLVFIQNQNLYRFKVSGDRYGGMPTIYGDGQNEFELVSSTMTLDTGDGAGFSTVQVHRVGATFEGGQGAALKRIDTYSGPALAYSSEKHTVDFNEAMSERHEAVAAAGIGFVPEAAVGITVTGDVTVESITSWLSPGSRQW